MITNDDSNELTPHWIPLTIFVARLRSDDLDCCLPCVAVDGHLPLFAAALQIILA
jgi:hypothetical protein